MRLMSTAGVVIVASTVGAVFLGTSSAASLAGRERPVDRHIVEFPSLGPFSQSSNGGAFGNPFVGNGDVAMSLDISRSGPGRRPGPDGNQAIAFGKSDYWISDAGTYFSHLAAARLHLNLPLSPSNYSASGKQDIVTGTLSWNLGPKQGPSQEEQRSPDAGALPSLNASSIIGESNNIVITTLSCNAGRPACPIDVTLSDSSNNAHRLQTYAGVDQSRSVCHTPSTHAQPSLQDIAFHAADASVTAAYDSLHSGSVWWRKENVHEASNPAYVGSCDPFDALFSVERSFVVSTTDSMLSMNNGSCLWLDDPGASSSTVSTGSCNAPQGKWKWVPHNEGKEQYATNGTGDIVYAGLGVKEDEGSDSKLCLSAHPGRGNVGLAVDGTGCGKGQWTFGIGTVNSSLTQGYLGLSPSVGAHATGCLVVVPDNSNNTLAVATSLIDVKTGKAPTSFKVKPVEEPGPSTFGNVSSGFTATLEPGGEYVLLTALLTLRDIDCAGTREETASCKSSVEAAALAMVADHAQESARQKVMQEHAAWWSSYWTASAIDLFGNDTTKNQSNVERFWYLQQYCMACTTRPGKVAPALIGNLVMKDPPAWNDQLTLDYNFEANFWGAGSSNHAEMLEPYIATVTNPGLVASMRMRATNPGVWRSQNPEPPKIDSGTRYEPNHGQLGETTGWSVPVGHTATHAVIVPKGVPNETLPTFGLTGSTGFKGAAWTSTAFPLGDGRPDPSDYSTRFVGALIATDLIQYYEYTLDETTLRERIYPFVKDNALFYESYVVDDPKNKSLVTIPWGCAQEVCACRNGGPGYGGYKDIHVLPQRNMTKLCETAVSNATDRANWNCPGAYADTGAGEHNTHADIAFMAQSLRKAIEYSTVLNVDSELRPGWATLLTRLPPYPTVELEFQEGALGSEVNGQTLLTEGLVGPTATPEAWYDPKEPGKSGPVWPWCNSEYPITNYAAMWPTDEIGTVQSSKELVQAAHNTVWAINQYTGYDFAGSKMPWANSNGFCLSWPPAVRVSDHSDTADLLGRFSPAIASRMAQNGLVSFRGGMLENMGATVAINDMLLQSHAGRLRFFPVWNAQAVGPASFTTLRAYGAFLVTASVASDGTVAPITIRSEKGALCTFESPWAAATTVKTQSGATVKVTAIPTEGADVFSFPTVANTTYILSSV